MGSFPRKVGGQNPDVGTANSDSPMGESIAAPKPWPEPDMFMGIKGGPEKDSYGHSRSRFADVPHEVTVPAGTRIFHGTSAAAKFDVPRGPASFALEPRTAQLYADFEGEGAKPRVLAFVTVRSARCLDHPGAGPDGEKASWWLSKWADENLGRGFTKEWGMLGYARVPDKLEIIRSAGYDGIVIRKLDAGGTEVCLFEPERFVEPAGMSEAEIHPVVYYRSQGKSGMGGNQYPVPSTMAAGPSREDQEQDAFDEVLVPYRSLGLTDPDDIRDLAILTGDALAEALLSEDEPPSVALVLMPCEPPGRQVAGWIRQLAQRFSRSVLCLYPGSVSYPGMAKALQLSLPDVIGKLRLLPIAGPSLAAALDAAKLGDIRPGHALQVFVPGPIMDQIVSERDGGGLPVDPTTVMVSTSGVPQDDPQKIRNVLAQPTDAPAKQALDPHVFSNPRGMDLMRQALGEALQVEFLKDISPNRDRNEGATRILQIVEANEELLRQRGVETIGMRFLGAGNNGLAWELEDGRVLKVTTDDAEAAVAVHLKGKRLKHVFQVHDVWAFPGKFEGHHVYGLITEGGLTKLPENERREFTDLISFLESFSSSGEFRVHDLSATVRAMMGQDPELDTSEISPDEKRWALRGIKKFDLLAIAEEFRRLGIEPDLHGGNLMRRPDGSLVVIDIGTGGDQEAAKPPFIEQRRRRIKEVGMLAAPQNYSPRGGFLGRGGNASSSWSSGRLALRNPADHVPVDDNEKGQIELDTQYGVKLPQPEEYEDEFGRKS